MEKVQKDKKRKGASSYRVEVSKTMSYLLRHGAQENNLEIDSKGFVSVDELLNSAPMKKVKANFESLMDAVNQNDKSRFEVIENNKGKLLIRAVQGHTIKEVKSEDSLEAILNIYEFTSIIHGTYYDAWNFIKRTGLNKMSRNQIHMAIGGKGDKNVISGMRGSCEVYVEIDGPLCVANSISMFISKNKVILSPGIDGVIDPRYFKKVVSSDGKLLMACQYENVIFPYFLHSESYPNGFRLIELTALNCYTESTLLERFAYADNNNSDQNIDLNEFSREFIVKEFNKKSTILVLLESQVESFKKYIKLNHSKLEHIALYNDYIPINVNLQGIDSKSRLKLLFETLSKSSILNGGNILKLELDSLDKNIGSISNSKPQKELPFKKQIMKEVKDEM